MSVLIKGMEMPKEGLNQERISITIWADGSVTNDGDYFRNEDGSYRKEYWNYEQFSAIELPPHGDLIDRDALEEKSYETEGGYAIVEWDDVVAMPTIIEADTCNNSKETCNKSSDDAVNASKTGKWIEKRIDHTYVNGYLTEYRVVCSVCGGDAFDDTELGVKLTNFCPNCGARMVEDDE